MEHLTKQQIVLLTLLVSFVTSMATGIITVSLMDQGRFDITQVINKIERPIAETTTSPVAAVVKAEPTLPEITSKISQNIVRFKPMNGSAESVLGIGLILSADGLILADKAALRLSEKDELAKGITAVLPDDREVPIQVIQTQILGDIAFVAALLPKNVTLTPVTSPANLASTLLGDNVYALSGKQSAVLEDGIIKKVPVTTEDTLETSIPSKNLIVGSPLFTRDGKVIGFKTTSLLEGNSFYPLPALRAIAPQLTR